jgi:hypothetical protein
MRNDSLNPKQKWLIGKWYAMADIRPKTLIEWLQSGGHTFDSVWSMTMDYMEEHQDQAKKLLLDSLTWGLFDIFECPSNTVPSNEQIDWIVSCKKGQ